MLGISFALLEAMPRKKFNLDPESIYHVSARVRNKDWYELPMDTVWEIMSYRLFALRYFYGVRIYAFVLMNNHFHMLVQAPNNNLSEAMQDFMSATSRDIQSLTGRINQIWGKRFSRSRLGNSWHVLNCYKYIYRNPVRAGMVERVEDYRFSTLPGLLGKSHLFIPVEHDVILFEDCFQKVINWLNTPSKKEVEESIKRALRFRDFKLAKINKRPNPGDQSPL